MAALPLLTQSEFIEELADETGWSKGDVRAFLNGLENVLANNMKEGYRVKVGGIVVGPVLKAARKARMGRNPQTGEAVKIKAKPASVVLKAKIVKPLKDVKLPSAKSLGG
jgi:nucleoid DNA-binding protein